MSVDNPYRSPQEFDDPTSARKLGWIPHIRAVAALLFIHGCLLVALGGILAMTAILGPKKLFADSFGPEYADFAHLYFGIAAAAALIPGILSVIAGCLNFFVRGRILGLIALFLGLFSGLTFYCLPSAFCLFIYGVIVYFNASTAAAFRLGAQGRSWKEILSAAQAGRLPT